MANLVLRGGKALESSHAQQESQSIPAVATAASYQHNPLNAKDEIRILHLQPGSGESPLKCSIEHVYLHDKPEFTAISYVWGSSDMPCQMFVGDNQVIQLTDSLDTLLRDMRQCKDITTMTFWVDQICIDQSNNTEKNQQVSMMCDIYKVAREVITYIGPKGPSDDEGLDLAMKIFNLFGCSWEHARTISTEEAKTLASDLPEEGDPLWKSLQALVYREWTERLWMVQENIVNKNTRLACGTRLIPWEALVVHAELSVQGKAGFFLLPSDDPSSASEQRSMQRMQNLRLLARLKSEYNEHNSSFLGILIKEHVLHCRIPKDKIYALIGIGGGEERLDIPVDYNLNDVEVFHDAAKRILSAGGDCLDILHYAGVNRRGLPSWAPDWVPDGRRSFWGGFDNDHSASGQRPAIVKFEEEGHVLVVDGIFIDEIAYDAGILQSAEQPLAFSNYSPETLWRFQAGLAALCRQLGVEYREEQPILTSFTDLEFVEMFAMTLLEGIWRGGQTPQLGITIGFLIWLSCAQITSLRGRKQSQSDAKFAELEEFGDRLRDHDPNLDWPNTLRTSMSVNTNMTHSIGKNICSTKGKLLCTSRSQTKPGDQIVALSGGKRCYILRPLGDEQYEFISDAYLYGYMKGRAFEDPELAGKMQKIRIW